MNELTTDQKGAIEDSFAIYSIEHLRPEKVIAHLLSDAGLMAKLGLQPKDDTKEWIKVEDGCWTLEDGQGLWLYGLGVCKGWYRTDYHSFYVAHQGLEVQIFPTHYKVREAEIVPQPPKNLNNF